MRQDDQSRSRGTGPSRREFLGALAGALAVGRETLAMQSPGPAGIPLRPLGRSGASVSIVGYGGWDCVIGDSEADCIAPPPRGDRPRHHVLGQRVGVPRRAERKS